MGVCFQSLLKIAQLLLGLLHFGFEGFDSLLDFRMLVAMLLDGHVLFLRHR